MTNEEAGPGGSPHEGGINTRKELRTRSPRRGQIRDRPGGCYIYPYTLMELDVALTQRMDAASTRTNDHSATATRSKPNTKDDRPAQDAKTRMQACVPKDCECGKELKDASD